MIVRDNVYFLAHRGILNNATIATGTKHAFPVIASYKGVWGHAPGKF